MNRTKFESAYARSLREFMLRAAFLLFCAALVTCTVWRGACLAASVVDSGLSQRFQTALANAVDDYLVPGAVAAIQSPDGEVWHGAAGWADIGPKTPMSIESAFSHRQPYQILHCDVGVAVG